jgi:hypothetical protein
MDCSLANMDLYAVSQSATADTGDLPESGRQRLLDPRLHAILILGLCRRRSRQSPTPGDRFASLGRKTSEHHLAHFRGECWSGVRGVGPCPPHSMVRAKPSCQLMRCRGGQFAVSPAVSAHDQRLQAVLQELLGYALAARLKFVPVKRIPKSGALESCHQIAVQYKFIGSNMRIGEPEKIREVGAPDRRSPRPRREPPREQALKAVADGPEISVLVKALASVSRRSQWRKISRRSGVVRLESDRIWIC